MATGWGLRHWPKTRVQASVPQVQESEPEPPVERLFEADRADATVSPPTPEVAAHFQEGFCAPEGSETIKTTQVLTKLLGSELDRRRRVSLGVVDAEETWLIAQAFKPFDTSTQREQLRDALRIETRLPNSPWPKVVIALLGKALGLADVEQGALRRVQTLLPHDPAVGLAIALATRHLPDLDEAIAGLTDSLAVDRVPGFARLKARLEVQRDIQRTYRRFTHRGLTLLWAPGVITDVQALQLLEAVDAALEEAAQLTGTTRRETLTVVVYPSRSELLAVSCVPTWAGGLFDGVLRLVTAPQFDLGVSPQTLRHETLHAQLTPIAPSAPLWFHEGLAQSFAQQEPVSQWALMVRNHAWIPFESLDGTFAIFSASDASLAYAQSLAMIDCLTETCGSNALKSALAAFQNGANTAQALATACGRTEVTGARLLAYLAGRLEREPDGATPPTP